MKKFIRSLIIIFLVTISPIASMFIYGSTLDNAYEDTFLAELNDKYELLANTNEKKIVFIGGSSLPFGLKSDYIEASTGYKVVDFGLYATLGTNLMMELSKVNINEGDVIILAPEVNEQTYSLYFNANTTLTALESNPSMMKYMSFDEKMDLFYNYYSYLKDKKEILDNEGKANAVAPYSHDSFNEYGDISYYRKNNIMPSEYDSSNKVSINESLLDDDFIDYINKYIKYVNRKKASIFFTYSPVNELAVNSNSNLKQFEEALSSSIRCDILGSIDNFIYNKDYFYDTNYHLNDAGAIIHSKNLTALITDKLQIENKWNYEDPIINPGGSEQSPSKEFSYYTYTSNISNGKITITGVKDEYKSVLENVIVPDDFEGNQIIEIASEAFKDCVNLKSLTLPSSIFAIGDNAFMNCSSLEKLILHSSPPVVQSTGLFNSQPDNFHFYVEKKYYSTYKGDYTWSKYAKYLLSLED